MKRSVLSGFVALVLMLSAALAGAAQAQPAQPCPPSQIEVMPWPPGPEPRLAEVVGKGGVAFMGCSSPVGCLRLPEERGAMDQVDSQQGKWTCGYLTDETGGGSGWIRSDVLRPITFDLHPPNYRVGGKLGRR